MENKSVLIAARSIDYSDIELRVLAQLFDELQSGYEKIIIDSVTARGVEWIRREYEAAMPTIVATTDKRDKDRHNYRNPIKPKGYQPPAWIIRRR